MPVTTPPKGARASLCALFRALRLPVFVVAAFVLLAATQAHAQKPAAEFQTSAAHAILIDYDSGTVLFEKSADTLMFPASLSKLMTAEVVFHLLKEGRITLDTEYEVSENAWRKGGGPSHGSSMFANVHSKVRVEDLLRGVIIQSGNDACIVLAEGIAGTELQFADMMNRRAKEIGLTKSHFVNSTGLHDPDHQMTARDLATLARHLIATYPDLYKIYGEREFTWNKIRQQNRNPLLAMGLGADGLKTGYTKEAGYGLVGSAVQGSMRLIVVVNGLKSSKERADEGRRLLEWGFKNFEGRPLFAENETIGEAKVYGGSSGRVPLVANGPVRILVQRAGHEKITAKIVYTGPVPAPIEKDQPIGRLKIWRGETAALEVPLRAGASISRGNLPQRAFDAATELVIGLFRAGAERL